VTLPPDSEEPFRRFPYPFLVLRWIEGIPLNSCRRRVPGDQLLATAEALGGLVARIASLGQGLGLETRSNAPTPPSSPQTLLSVTKSQLLRGRARDVLADAVWRLLAKQSARFDSLGSEQGLAHGDLGGRNIVVAADGNGGWRAAAILDWEDAFTGWALWDVGSLFRYPKRYGAAFRERFEKGYRAEAGQLPADWWRTARLLDVTRQVATLDDERELTVPFRECRELLEAALSAEE
jgi:Ser/Thr protein kinase RdoA (MazF antagonist)